MKYTFYVEPGTPFLAKDAKAVGPVLLMLSHQHGENFKPAHVVEAARDKKSRLHSYFEWDDRVAAEKFRLKQAGKLITSIRFKPVDNGKAEERFYRVKSGFVPTRKAAEDVDMTEYILHEAEVGLRGWMTRLEKIKAAVKAHRFLSRAVAELSKSKRARKAA